jgi:cytidylate kinase
MAPDAVLIDTSGLSIVQAVAQAVAVVARRLAEG